MKSVIDQMEVRLTQTEVITGVKTGFDDIDRATCGLQDTDLIILGARPSMGKTTLAMNIAATSALNGKEGVTLIFSMEMSQQQLQQRLLASEGGIRLHAIQRPKEMQQHEWTLLNAATQKILKAKMVVDELLAESCTLLVPTFSWDTFGIPSPPHLRPARNGSDYGKLDEQLMPKNEQVYTSDTMAIDDDMGAIPTAVITASPRVRGYHPLCMDTSIVDTSCNYGYGPTTNARSHGNDSRT